jgi:hypothetical protein
MLWVGQLTRQSDLSTDLNTQTNTEKFVQLIGNQVKLRLNQIRSKNLNIFKKLMIFDSLLIINYTLIIVS